MGPEATLYKYGVPKNDRETYFNGNDSNVARWLTRIGRTKLQGWTNLRVLDGVHKSILRVGRVVLELLCRVFFSEPYALRLPNLSEIKTICAKCSSCARKDAPISPYEDSYIEAFEFDHRPDQNLKLLQRRFHGALFSYSLCTTQTDVHSIPNIRTRFRCWKSYDIFFEGAFKKSFD